ncbi:uncharacterized protein LOC62_05G007658 [Vanrija pseudolonga]|uniref:Uncharacterized protein n=1 Tax=Vanrija pseudolonga TaxID=143232 RepID=A0AAF0YDW6_9TREE|nr:hypothetical protein LOC62_05G007658 [Vanrija pseudolonga]
MAKAYTSFTVIGSLTPYPEAPATNKTWPADWYWSNISSSNHILAIWRDTPIVPGPGYYLTLHSDSPVANITTYAVSELFEIPLTPNRGAPATNKTWPADQYWVDFVGYDAADPKYDDPPIVPGTGYYVTLRPYDPRETNFTSFAVSELFEIRDTKKGDPSLPGGPYGPVHNAAGNLVPHLSLVLLSGAIGAWYLL